MKEKKRKKKRGKPYNGVLTVENKMRLLEGRWTGGLVKSVMVFRWDEHWVLYLSDESLILLLKLICSMLTK